MGLQRKGGTRVTEDPEELTRHPLQAILLADSFTTKFRPITLERPKVIEYLENSEWHSMPNFTVTTIESHNSISAGDALRLIYERNVTHGEFVLVSGDTVSNMSLTEAIQEHKERRKKDNNAVMTMVIKQSKPSPISHQSRLGTDELFLAIDPQTKQLLYFEEKADHLQGVIDLDNMLLADDPSISLHNDKQDCYIDICSPEVLSLFTDNFDYQHLRRHFVKELLVDDVVIGPQFVVPAYSKVSLLQQPTIEDSDEELECADNNSGILNSSITGTVDNLNGEMASELSGMKQWPLSELGTSGAGYVWSIPEGGHEDEWRHSVAPIRAEKLAEALQAIEDDSELLNLVGSAQSLSGEQKPDFNSNDSDVDDDSRDDTFEKEVEATFLRAVYENIKVGDIILEMNSLRLSCNMTSADCAGAILYAMMKLALENAHADGKLYKNVTSVVDKWQELLKFCAKEIDDQIEVILKFEEMCLESAKEFTQIFSQILSLLYDRDILDEDAILRWADEKKDADESDKVFVKKSESFIQWLKEASEEED